MLLAAPLALAALPPPHALDAAARFDPATGAPAPRACRGTAPLSAAPADDGNGYDVEDYVLRVRIDRDARTVEGHGTLTVARTAEGPLVLHADGPEIAAITADGAAADWERADDEVRIDLGGAARATVDVTWTWSGPSHRDGGLQWGEPTFSFHEPEAARRWLVLRDVPFDKATLRWEITVDAADVVAANGVLEDVTPHDDGTATWRFDFDAPIATYLMAVHIGDYVVLDLTAGGDVPVAAWVYPGMEAAALDTFGNTSEILAFFSDLHAPYPWTHYGNAVAPFGGGMEHTTVTTFGEELVGDEFGELVNVHEVGHHWWGNDVTLGTWADIWLNEGFASYTEALWYERAYGQEGLAAYVRYQADTYLRWRGYEGTFALYDPDYLWGGTVYEKGSLVLHMLRGVLGDERFFAALSDYEAAYHLQTAVTTDFIASVEASAGEDLGWFFDPWLYEAGEPAYRWSWAAQPAPEGWQVDIVVTQDRPEFTMPVPVRLTLADGSVVDTKVRVGGAGGSATLCLDAEPVAAAFDPDAWLLTAGSTEEAGAPGEPRCGLPDDDTGDTAPPDSGGDLGAYDAPGPDALEVGGDGCGCDGGGGAPGLLAVGAAAAALGARRRRP